MLDLLAYGKPARIHIEMVLIVVVITNENYTTNPVLLSILRCINLTIFKSCQNHKTSLLTT